MRGLHIARWRASIPYFSLHVAEAPPCLPVPLPLLLAGNQLSCVPDSLTELVNLQDLNLSGNQLVQLPDGIGALTALTMLSLHGNQLTVLPAHGWQQLGELKEVTLQGNCLTAVPDSLAQLKVIRLR